MKVRRLQPRDERGAAAIEFTLVLVPLLLILGGIVDFGSVFAEKNALNQSVREGARYAVVQPVGPAPNITKLVQDAAKDSFIGGDASNIVVKVTDPDGDGNCNATGLGNNLTVTATYTAHPPMGLVNALLPGEVLGDTVLTSQTTFRCEW